MFPKLLLLFTIVPIAELYVLLEIGGQIGAGNTVLVIIITAIVGAYLAKTEGIQVITRLQTSVADGRPPGHELLHGFFVLVGGITLLTPGFITDFIGFTMLIPPLRSFYVAYATRLIANKLQTGQWRISSY